MRTVLESISKAGGVPADRIRPEDRLGEFPRKGLVRGVRVVQMFLAPVVTNAREKQTGVEVAPFEMTTVDDVIRHLEPAHGDVFRLLEHQNHE